MSTSSKKRIVKCSAKRAANWVLKMTSTLRPKPVVWVSALMSRFEEQLPCRIGPQTHHSRINVQQNKESLIHISKWKFSLVISGLTKILTKLSDLRTTQIEHFERDYHESQIIVLDTLEKCLSSQAPEAPKYDDVMNVKLLLKEMCQFLDVSPSETSTQVMQIRNLASKVKEVNPTKTFAPCNVVYLTH